jgi:UDP-glucose 4-epimerase
MSIVVIGASSFIAQALRSAAPDTWVFLPHAAALENDNLVRHAHVVINCAFSPALRAADYDPAEDIDSALAAKLGPDTRYIMLSSRLVYGPSPNGGALAENMPENPVTPYARNKLRIERQLRGILNERLTVLRLANIFGHERGRASFFGLALTSLVKDEKIIFDMSPTAERDFLSVWRCAEALVKIAEAPASGIFNLGSGFPTACGTIAEWLIAGYGRGALVADPRKPDDSFYLDMTKTRAAWPQIPSFTPTQLEDDCRLCGRMLSLDSIQPSDLF